MATECIECGKQFKGFKCSCGNTLKTSGFVDRIKADAAFEARKLALESASRSNLDQDKRILEVLNSVPAGEMKWAHSIIALESAGLYKDAYGIQFAKKALGVLQ